MMWSKKLLAALLIVSVACSSCFAFAFLPSYSGHADERDTALLSTLRSIGSDESEKSSTADAEPADCPDGMVCYTEDEVKEMDRELAKVEEDLTAELDPFHFGLGLSLGWTDLTTLLPGIDMQFRWNDLIVNGGVSYPLDWAGGIRKMDFDPRKIQTRLGVMYEW